MQNNNSKLNTILLIIIIILLATGIFLFSQKSYSNNNGKLDDQYEFSADPIIDGNNSVKNESTQNVNWQSFTKQEFEKIITQYPDIWFEKDFGLSLSKTLDLTGDGIPEAIISGNGGNNSISFILRMENGKPLVTKMKQKNGSIVPIQLLELGRISGSMSYGILPSNDGFYTTAFVRKTDNENDEGELVCDREMINAYVWKPSSRLFEWDANLTAKYISEVCK